ncbi:MAG: hypothetical protein HYZ75_03480 [Elusimicrobia bacterium]|nr:hypothetical protein [Elusimicrobiota bacterium]
MPRPLRVRVALDSEIYHPDAVLGAAHVLARRMRVWLRPDGRGGTQARLANAEGGRLKAATLEALFLDEAAAQELRRRSGAANRALREYIVTQALLSAGRERRDLPPALSPEEDAEVDRLIAEVEGELAAKAAGFDADGSKTEERGAP